MRKGVIRKGVRMESENGNDENIRWWMVYLLKRWLLSSRLRDGTSKKIRVHKTSPSILVR